MAEFPNVRNEVGVAVTHFLVVEDIQRSLDFYSKLGAEVVRDEMPAVVQWGSGWLTINYAGEPTPDKPEVELVTPEDSNRVSSFLNLWVKDLDRIYREWSDLGVEFLTEPKDLGHEKRVYFRDPDGHLVEVGERRFAE